MSRIEIELSAGEAEVMEVMRAHFQVDFYLAMNPDVERAGIDPLLHYTLYGWREGRDPNPDFSTNAYLTDHPDVADAGVHPFWHYVTAGVAEGRLVRRNAQKVERDTAIAREAAAAIKMMAPHFDVDFYLQTYPDVARSGADPVEHYYLYGWKENRDPTDNFSTLGYLEHNQDVYAAGINPFWHYIVAGKAEGRIWRAPEPTTDAPEATATTAPRVSADQIAQEAADIRDTFDAGFYLSRNPDVARAGIDPLQHFVSSGWREGRDPNHAFSTSYYLDSNSDVREQGINPYWHYLVAGKAEGRLARHPGGVRAETLMKTYPLEETVQAWRTRSAPEALLSAEGIREALLPQIGRKRRSLMISVGHDNYREISGGLQFCLQHEEDLASARGTHYLNLHPYQPLPRLAHIDQQPDVTVSLLLDGKMLGPAAMSSVIEAIRSVEGAFRSTNVVVHHLLGHQPEQIAELVRATGDDNCYLWLHDFFTLCTSFALQRNNVTFCGAPPAASNACTLCLYGAERQSHRRRIAAFFEVLKVHVIAPSRFAAEYWSDHTDLVPASLIVRDHIELSWTPRRAQGKAPEQGPILIAFVGYPAAHKGWPTFERLVREYAGEDSPYRFIYFGTSEVGLEQVKRVPIRVSAEDPHAMIRAIAEERVDFVLHWATWTETFSFSTFEALAGGAFVLTNPISGNVAVTVRRQGLGAVLEDEADLEAFFRDERAMMLAAEVRDRRRLQGAKLSRSDMTFSVVGKESTS